MSFFIITFQKQLKEKTRSFYFYFISTKSENYERIITNLKIKSYRRRHVETISEITKIKVNVKLANVRQNKLVVSHK